MRKSDTRSFPLFLYLQTPDQPPLWPLLVHHLIEAGAPRSVRSRAPASIKCYSSSFDRDWGRPSVHPKSFRPMWRRCSEKYFERPIIMYANGSGPFVLSCSCLHRIKVCKIHCIKVFARFSLQKQNLINFCVPLGPPPAARGPSGTQKLVRTTQRNEQPSGTNFN